MVRATPVGGLKWVEGEIAASLERVRASLEAFAEGGEPQTDLSGAVDALNEIRGVLVAIQLTGPSRLVEEMQQLCEGLVTGRVADAAGGAEALMLALIQLPDYLAKLQAGRPEVPLGLLPAINDLRGSRGAGPLTEAELLVPTSVLADSELPSPEVQKALARVAGRVRPYFHRCLVQWFKPETAREGLVNLGRLFHQLRRYIQEGIFHELFLAAEAVTEALLDGSIPSDAYTKALVGHLDRVIKPFSDGSSAWPEDEAQSLLVDFLSLVAKCGSSAYLVTELRRAYGLDGATLDDDHAPAATSPEAVSVLVDEARKELLPIKDALDLFARGQRGGAASLSELEPLVRNLANTLAVTGADAVVERLRGCAETIGAVAKGTLAADDARLMSVAEELLAAEAELAELGGRRAGGAGEETRRLLVSALAEAHVDMAKAELAINALAADPTDLSLLDETPALFHRVAGALRVMAEIDAADALDRVVDQIRQRFLATGRSPLPDELELLARAISAIELYLEGLAGGESYRHDLVADAASALDALARVEPPEWPASPALPLETEALAAASAGEGPAHGGSAIDPEFLEIFLEEAEEEEQTIRDQFARWSRDERDEVALTTLRRSFHTLKGSGRLVGAERVGDLARAVEALLNRVIDRSVGVTADLVTFVGEAVACLPDLIAAEADGRHLDMGHMITRAEALAAAAVPGPGTGFTDSEMGATGKVIPWPVPAASGIGAEPGAEVPVPDEEAEEGEAAEAAELAALADIDEELLDIFRAEARDHLDVLRELVRSGGEGGRRPDPLVMRALHTLTGSARMTGIDSFAAATAAVDRLMKHYRELGIGLEEPDLALLSRALDGLELRLEHLPGGGSEIAALRQIARDAQARLEQVAAEPARPLAPAPPLEQIPPGSAAAAPPGESILGDAQALELSDSELGGLGLGESEEVAEVEAALPESEEAMDAVAAGPEAPPPEEAAEAAEIEAALPESEEVIEALAAAPEAVPFEEPAETAEVESVLPESEEAIEAVHSVLELAPPEEAVEGISPAAEGSGLTLTADVRAPAPIGVPAAELEPLPEDAELLSLFLEDARDILDKLDESLRELHLAPTAQEPLVEQQRLLHTLKGSARLSGLAAVGDLSHAYESLLTAITKGHARVGDDTLELAQRTLDTLAEQVDAVGQGRPIRRAGELVQALALALEEGLAGPTGVEPDVAVMLPAPAAAPERATYAEAPSPQIRVRAELLDRLVDHSGEISIYRSRLAQHSAQLGFRLQELDQTVARLREQLRLLDIETEVQIIHRYERDAEAQGKAREVFDPLELDRFSTLQQLSRSLAETVNDLVSLRTLLGDLHGESETLLLQQARIADELQDGLLRTRMVPFAQLVPRLHRLVRQTAQQLGKKAHLEVFGADLQLDRSIQQRIAAPLEHLLRNAVAHGIEPPEDRESAGKTPEGVVSLMLDREGNDAVVTVADDGAGLDLEAIRRRAVERGLLAADTEMGEDQIGQLILASGFSTAPEVTQIAGRGVGLDVVNAEIKQLSGSVTLDTQSGRGTSFTIRLPLTLAIIEALLVQVGGEIYAIPHTTIEGAARIARQDLEDCYAGGGCAYTYAGNLYRTVYLGSLLETTAAPDLGERRWLPVVLARAGDQRVAFHVDGLIGTQRVVVKPLGSQLGSIRWLSGGTILPDGRVAMILDLLALIRSGAVYHAPPPRQVGLGEGHGRTCVMVVDDSLTVRRVTSRLLRRHDIDVIGAQDGVEALAMLDDRLPDLILLDIEMPRMDGYELTRHIRRSPRLKDIPIVMITSRTGDKHRRYAMELGVDRYLGKPYQETELLDEIGSVLMERGT